MVPASSSDIEPSRVTENGYFSSDFASALGPISAGVVDVNNMDGVVKIMVYDSG